MLKWLTTTGGVIVIVAVVLVTRYDQFHDTEGKGYDIQCTQSSEPAATLGTMICTAEHSQKAKNGQYDPDWWHVFFAWPEGITALLLLLTLGAITWQAVETRKSAEATSCAAKTAAKDLTLSSRAWVSAKVNNFVFSEGKPLLVYINLRMRETLLRSKSELAK